MSKQGTASTVRKLKRIFVIMASLALLAVVALVGILVWHAIDRNTVDLKSDVIVYTEGASPYTLLSSDQDSITVSSADTLHEGDIFASDVTEAAPSGLLRRIGAAEQVDNGIRYATTQASLTDAIERCNIKATIAIEQDGTYRINQNASNRDNPFIEQAFADENPDNLFSVSNAFGEASAGNIIDVELKVTDGSDIRFALLDHLYAGASVNGISGTATLFDRAFKPITIWVGPLPVVLTPSMDVIGGIDANLQDIGFEAEASLDRTFGFEYTTKGGLRSYCEDASQAPRAEFSPSNQLFVANLHGTLAIGFNIFLYGTAGPEVHVGLDGDVNAKLQVIPEGEPTDGAIVIPGVDQRLRGHLSEKVTLPIEGRFVLQTPSNPFDSQRDPLELINVDLFDTGDAITLLDENQRFSYAYETCEYGLCEGNTFAFEFPDTWEIHQISPSSFDPKRAPSSFSKYMGGIVLTKSDDPEIDVSFQFLVEPSDIPRYSITFGKEIAASSLIPKASSISDAEPFAVLETIMTPNEGMVPDELSKNIIKAYALMPASYAGFKGEYYYPEPVFSYGDWPGFSDSPIFIAADSSGIDDLNEEDRSVIADILSSFRSI